MVGSASKENALVVRWGEPPPKFVNPSISLKRKPNGTSNRQVRGGHFGRLILLFGFSQVEAQGTSSNNPAHRRFAALVYYQHGFVRLPVVGLIAAGFMAGAFLGAKLVPHVPLELLRITFGVLLLYLGFAFIMSPRGNASEAALPAGLAAVLAWSPLCSAGNGKCKLDGSSTHHAKDEDYHI